MRNTTSPIPALRSDARILLYVLLLLATVFAVGPAVASEYGDISRLTIMPGTLEAEIPLDGLVVFGGEAYTATVVEPPRFGTWGDEVYVPTDAFWRLGGDRVTLEVTRSSGRTELETIVLMAGQPWRVWSLVEDFESANGVLDDSKYQILGDASKVYLTRYGQLEGEWSLAVDLSGAGSGIRAKSTLGGGITGVDHQGGKTAINPDLPGGGGGGGGNAPTQPAPFVLYSQAETSAIQMKVEYGPDGSPRTFVRGSLDRNAFGCISNCSTPWREIPTSAESVISLWWGEDVAFHPGVDTYDFHFVVEPAGSSTTYHDTVDDLRSRPNGNISWTVGAMGDSVQSIDGTIHLDVIESWSDQLAISDMPKVIAEDFTGGSWSDRWQVLGPFGTATPFRYDSASVDWRGLINLRDVPKGGRALLVHDRPVGEIRMRTEFEVGLGAADLGTNMVYTIWGTSTTDAGVGDPTAVHPVEIDVKAVKGQLFVRARALDDRHEEQTTRWLPVDTADRAALTPVVLHWWAERGDLGGGLHLRVGEHEAKLSGLQNRSLKVEEHGIGFWNLRAEGLTSPSFVGADPQLSFDNVLVMY